jgi:outer membrane lipoprotein carrier protein
MHRLPILLLTLLLPVAVVAGEAGTQLRTFLETTRTLDATFVQERVGEQGAGPSRATGRLRLQRPGRFRWDYLTPYSQLILADGERLWIFDPDLEQATVRPQDEALGNSPARLLSGGLDLDANFSVIETDVRDDGLDWIEVRPLGSDEEFSQVRFGFTTEGLSSMLMIDNLGYTTLIEFNNIKSNIELDQDVFAFTPPPGVDVLGE